MPVNLPSPFSGTDYLLSLPMILLTLFALGILLIDLMLPPEWKWVDAATAIVGSTELYLPLEEMIDLDEERGRLAKEIDKAKDELLRVQKKLSNTDFLNKAKEEVVQKEREKAGQYQEKIRTLNLSLERLEEFQAGRS